MENYVLPTTLTYLNQNINSKCVFCKFMKALYEDYDIDGATALINEFDDYIKDDLLLKNLGPDLKKYAYLLVKVTMSKLFGTTDVSALSFGVTGGDISKNLDADGYETEVAGT